MAQARRFAAEALADLPGDQLDAIEIMVSELATNALLHAAQDFEIGIDCTDHQVRVEVGDTGGGMPELQWPSSDELHGRGLQVVAELSEAWGTSRLPDREGKAVWFTLRC